VRDATALNLKVLCKPARFFIGNYTLSLAQVLKALLLLEVTFAGSTTDSMLTQFISHWRIALLLLLGTLFFGCEDEEPAAPFQPEPIVVEALNVNSCLLVGEENALELVSWNLEQFPKEDDKTVASAIKAIRFMQADVVALQEMRSDAALQQMADSLSGFTLAYENNSGLDVAYIFRNSSVELLQPVYSIMPEEQRAFVREPLVLEIRHIASGEELTLVNLHLKCCGGSENEERRRNASELLQAYINTHWPERQVVVLGDFNDNIAEPAETNVFQNFIDDEENSRFLTMPIAQGSSENWSYPDWPSHLDQVLISNELFDDVKSIQVLKPDSCSDQYEPILSDHRPVHTVFSW
jgi:endonuclease/exonuclease/phosphatase family metal-dependent hydrolase